MGKRNKMNKIEGQNTLVNEATLIDSDRELLTIIRNYLDDML